MQALFEEHKAWAMSVGQSVGRHLPPSFDVDDLKQIALIQHWHCCKSYDPSPRPGFVSGVPYRAYAHAAIRGAVLMASRRRNYREATHEELEDRHIDEKYRPDAILLAREQRRNSNGPKEWRQRQRLQRGLLMLSAKDAYLIRRVFLERVEAELLAQAWKLDEKEFVRQVGAAVRRLKRLVRATPVIATPSRSLAIAPELRTPSHQRPAILGWQPLRPPLRPQP
jgi:RNA polymerase sigma factor (sigma-70 family)